MRRQCTEKENQVIRTAIADILPKQALFGGEKNMDANRTFWINGGTVLNYTENIPDGVFLLFVEDDFVDSTGNPYIIKYPVYHMKNIKPEDRIILLYFDTGEFFPICVNEQTKGMISMENPSYFEHVDWNSCICLPHPNVEKIDQTARKMSKGEIAALVRKCISFKGMGARSIFATILLSLGIFLILAVNFIMLVGEEIITAEDTVIAIAIGECILWVALSFCGKWFCCGISPLQIRKLFFRKQVLFDDITTISNYNTPMKKINIYEYESGIIKRKSYLTNNNIFLPKNIKMGTIFNKYSMKKDSETSDINYFGTIDGKVLFKNYFVRDMYGGMTMRNRKGEIKLIDHLKTAFSVIGVFYFLVWAIMLPFLTLILHKMGIKNFMLFSSPLFIFFIAIIISIKKDEMAKEKYAKKYISEIVISDKRFGEFIFEKDSRKNELTCENFKVPFGEHNPIVRIIDYDENYNSFYLESLNEIYNMQEKIIETFFKIYIEVYSYPNEVEIQEKLDIKNIVICKRGELLFGDLCIPFLEDYYEGEPEDWYINEGNSKDWIIYVEGFFGISYEVPNAYMICKTKKMCYTLEE
ncbi:MAG: hypothetical protein HFJ09_02305 [Lachnospiraceae bacterium]|nr:hypothetical protein [Lachnospiraceae bacterium]